MTLAQWRFCWSCPACSSASWPGCSRIPRSSTGSDRPCFPSSRSSSCSWSRASPPCASGVPAPSRDSSRFPSRSSSSSSATRSLSGFWLSCRPRSLWRSRCGFSGSPSAVHSGFCSSLRWQTPCSERHSGCSRVRSPEANFRSCSSCQPWCFPRCCSAASCCQETRCRMRCTRSPIGCRSRTPSMP